MITLIYVSANINRINFTFFFLIANIANISLFSRILDIIFNFGLRAKKMPKWLTIQLLSENCINSINSKNCINIFYQFYPHLDGPLVSLILISKTLAENEKSFQYYGWFLQWKHPF